MKKNMVAFACMVMPFVAIAGKDVTGKTVNYVYQPDLAPTEFEFNANQTNSCGSNLYRVQSSDEATANRKFSIILTAFTANKKISFHDKEICSGSRSIVSWVRVTNL